MKHTYKFSRPYNADGTPTKWKQVVDFIIERGHVSKHDIIKHVWPNAGLIVERGYCSALFAELNRRNPDVSYNPSTKKWESIEYRRAQIKKQAHKLIRNSMYGPASVFDDLNAMMNKSVLPKASTKEMKVLAKTYSASHSMETVLWDVDGVPTRFKIISRNGNCYSHTTIEIMCKSLEYKVIYEDQDIPNVQSVAYYDSDYNRIHLSRLNINACKTLIKQIFA